MRDKQIEEMARTMCNCYNSGYCKMHGNSCDLKCRSGWNALGIYKAGYRERSDVARKIFEEIDSLLEGEEKRYENLSDEADDPRFSNEYWEASLTISSIRTILAKLKKKYESEDN
jgi:hypothetical protein